MIENPLANQAQGVGTFYYDVFADRPNTSKPEKEYHSILEMIRGGVDVVVRLTFDFPEPSVHYLRFQCYDEHGDLRFCNDCQTHIFAKPPKTVA